MSRRRRKPEEPRVDLERERRQGYLGAAAALGSLACSIASVPIAASGTGGGRIAAGGSDRDLLLDVSATGSGQSAAMVLRVVGLLLLFGVAWYCYAITKGRRPEAPGWVPIAGGVAFVLLAANTALGFTAVRDLANEYVASGPQTTERATQLLDGSAVIRGNGALFAQLGVNALFGTWLAMTCLDMMRVGLLARILAYFGFGAAVATAVGFPAGDALFFGWLGSLGILALGYWPGGRPPAWDEGRAVSWDEPAAQPLRPRRGSTL